jgi:arginyl-tRNA synthetase
MSLEDAWSQAIRAAAKRLWSVDLEGALLEPPADAKFGDATCNVAMRLAKQLKKPPRAIADELAADLRKAGLPHLAKVDVAGAGFVNLTAAPEFHQEEVKRILDLGADYGRSKLGGSRKVLVEHCSANPTGPLHIAHGRQAAVGDSLANLLDFAGFKVAREFYINDTGNQIEMLGKSIQWRMGGDPNPPDENAYKGDYIKTLAEEIKAQGRTFTPDEIKRYGKDRLLEDIKKDLEMFRVRYDTWTSEESLHKSGKVDEVLNFFNSWGLTYPKDGATYLKTTDHGDAEDKPIVKADGQFVYRLPDMAYHRDKYARGYDILIDLWGPDHHAHIATMMAGMKALNFNLAPIDQVRANSTLPPEQKPVAFEVLIIQHCKLLQGGQEVKMSKRAASYVTLRELMEEVGVDATRFFFVMRKTNSHLDFDMDVAKKKSLENPVYYAQYAHARICSIFQKGIADQKIAADEVKDGTWRGSFDPAKTGADEVEMIKVARQFQRRIEIAARDLDPAAMTDYLRELSATFQRYYEYGNRDESRRVQQVLRNGFRLLGVSAPEQM